MAGADYRNCDVCGCKAFYDANLDYGNYDRTDEDGYLLPMHNTGAWRVLCLDCAKTHFITISPRPVSP
jgi:hypothetical protein